MNEDKVYKGLQPYLYRIRRSVIVQNVFALSGAQMGLYVFPLLVVPYLARVLGPYYWGIVALAQALGLYLSLTVDFGFQFSGSRKISRLHDNREGQERVFAAIMGAKLFLASVCVVVVWGLELFVPVFRQYRAIIWMGAFSGIGQGLNILWLYQGLERLRTSASIDLASKALATAGIFVFVHKPSDAWKVLFLQFVCYVLGTTTLLYMASRELRFRWPSVEDMLAMLRESASMFLFNGAVSLYTTANTLILGSVATPIAVGLYSGAERITRAIISFSLTPVTQSLFPRLSRLIVSDQERAVLLARLTMAIMILIGGFCGCLLFFGAPTIIRVILGPHFDGAVPVLRTLSLLAPVIALSHVLGIQWMVPLGLDKALTRVVIFAGALNLALALWWASHWQQMGMAWAVVVAETAVAGGTFLELTRANLNPLSDGTQLITRLKMRKA